MQASKAAKQLLPLLDVACNQYPLHAELPAAIVKISAQMLYLYSAREYVCNYSVSTSRFGIGHDEGSYKTPTGIHCVQEKIGGDAEFSEIFKTRKPTREHANIEHNEIRTNEDCITSRILWLAGLEEGVNKGAGIDSYARYIYIHGTHEEGLIGQPASEGCIRMKNQDVIDLYDCLMISSFVIVSA